MNQGSHFHFRKVAVLGAGVMGAQIAAHIANADIHVVLFDLPAKEGPSNSIVNAALKRLTKLKPAPLSAKDKIEAITAANYDEHLELLSDCDLVIEAIAERVDLKQSLYEKISPFLKDNAILATNTSGLSINLLAKSVPEKHRSHFCVVHFFNPPRYMKLVELVAHNDTNPCVMDNLETFLVSVLGKGVIRGKDTPNFVANRIGVFSMLATLYHTEAFGLSYDVVDALTGGAIGRAKSATYRTIDVVGLDTLMHVIKTMADNLPDDPWKHHFNPPKTIAALIDKGAMGQKSGAGFYKKEGKTIKMLDVSSMGYVETTKAVSPVVMDILKIKNPVERFEALQASDEPQAQFLWACFRDLFHYTAYHLNDIAHSARDADLAIRWGFGWQQGPFETWQQAGWQKIAVAIEKDIAAGKTMSKAPLPAWSTQADFTGVYQPGQAFAPESESFIDRSDLAVYKRQAYPEPVLLEKHDFGTTIHETDAVRLWSQGDDIAILSFKSKLGTMGEDVLQGINESLEVASKDFSGLVIWQNLGDYFSVGANLKTLTDYLAEDNFDAIENYISNFQQTTSNVKYASIPVVAAAQGYALGGGCELLMHCDDHVFALETYSGLVELGVGLIPAGGGCKTLAARANGNLHKFAGLFKSVAMAEVSISAHDCIKKAFVPSKATVAFNNREILHIAKQKARMLSEALYRPPVPKKVTVTGDAGIATVQTQLVNMRDGGFISEYDYFLGTKLAEIMAGGYVTPGSKVDEAWLLQLEKDIFVSLTREANTQARVEHMLTTGKPLRN